MSEDLEVAESLVKKRMDELEVDDALVLWLAWCNFKSQIRKSYGWKAKLKRGMRTLGDIITFDT